MQVRRNPSVFSWLILSLIFVPFARSARAERVEDLPKPTNWVADFAHVLSPETTQRLDALCGQLSHSQANAQIEVVTINTLDGDDIDDFTNRLEEKWKIGKKGSDRGVVLLFAIQDHKRRIEVGFGLEGILPDGKVGDIGRSMVPALRQGNYDEAVTNGVVQIANVIAEDAHITLQDNQQARPHPQRSHVTFGAIVRLIIVVLVILFILFRVLGRFIFIGWGWPWFGGWGGGGGYGGGYGGGGWGGGDSGGGWGGGGDSGGGGGFDGSGGGDSGGGGASGDW